MTAEDIRAEPLPAGPARPASIHIPYVVTAALFALANGVCFHIPGGHPAHVVMAVIALVAFPLHVAWLSRLYRDARGVLAETVAMGEGRMRVLTILTAPVYCVWAPFALRLLYRAAHARAAERELTVAVRFAQLEEFALFLQRAGFLAMIVSLAVILKLGAAFKPYTDSGTVPLRMDWSAHLSPWMLWSQTLFQLLIGVAYVWFIATGIPLLYRHLHHLQREPAA